MSDDILTSVGAHVARLVFNRPARRNAVTGGMLHEVLAFARRVAADPDVRAVVISGAGDHFMAGGDVNGFDVAMTQTPAQRRLDFERRSGDIAPLWATLADMPQPVVVAVRGFAAGAALSFVAGADLVVASTTARFVLSHVGIGLVADAATTYHLPRVVGLRRAKQLALLGERITAEEALAMGLVNWVVPDDQLEARTDDVVGRLVAAPATSIMQAKHLMNGSLRSTIDDQVAAEGRAVGACAATDDLREGVSAFLERRQPLFNQPGLEP